MHGSMVGNKNSATGTQASSHGIICEKPRVGGLTATQASVKHLCMHMEQCMYQQKEQATERHQGNLCV